ncbi:hypothetical protein Tco_0459462 [Tanacetum coccineum]
MRISSLKCVDKAPYYPGFHGDHHDNPLLAKKTESKLIIWDIGDEEEEYTFIDNYSNFQEEENDVSFSGVEEKLMPVYDTDIECIVEEMVTCGDGEVIYVDHVESLMIQYLSIDDFEEDINTKSHELMWFKKNTIIKVRRSSLKFLIGKKYQEGYLKVAPIVDKLGFKTIKVVGGLGFGWLERGFLVYCDQRVFGIAMLNKKLF